MPVDLSIIPDIAERKSPPSLKRWLVVLLLLLVSIGVIASWLWPADLVTRDTLFWHSIITLPLVLWTVLLSCRWLFYLSTEWLADGWDDERQRDLDHEILRGQRFLYIDHMAIHLPHVVTFGHLSEQFLLPDGVVLPATADENTQRVSYHTAFDHSISLQEQVITRLKTLIDDISITSLLPNSHVAPALTVIVQISCEDALSKEDIKHIEEQISFLLPTFSLIQFSFNFGLDDIDQWLDRPSSFDYLLLLSVNVHASASHGKGEAAVALLFRSTTTNIANKLPIAYLHRPEKAEDINFLDTAALQSMQWGNTSSEDISSLWLAGLGIENQAQKILSSINFKLPKVEINGQLIDVDMKTGDTGVASSWLSIALAAGNQSSTPVPQLIMTIPNGDVLPWWIVIHPQAMSK